MKLSPWDSILDCCRNATEAVLVAPYIKVDALETVLDELQADVSLECYSRWTPLDIQSGASDLECRTLGSNRGGSFHLCNRLHAKYYRFDDQTIIGSANLTASGLSYAHSGNLEILCEPSNDFDWYSFESVLRLQAWEVTDEEFLLWQESTAFEVSPTNLGMHLAGGGLDNWKPQTRQPVYVWQSYIGMESQIPTPEQRELAKLDISTLAIPMGLSAEKFNAWIRSSLRASPFMDTLRELSQKEEATAWDVVAQKWHVERGVAARWTSTAYNWLRYFESGAEAL